jgi:hypothetical protein
MITPTRQTYDELQRAYEHFNGGLFDGALPSCLITLQRAKKTFGYFSADRFVSRDAQKTDEIAMNPAYFATRSVNEILATMVHEMVHLWQHHFGQPGRGRYHNRQCAEKMLSIGLLPTDTGVEGGKMTGDKVHHLIIKDGAFDLACQALLTKNFVISWLDRFALFGRQRVDGLDGIDAGVEAEMEALGISVETETANKSNRCKYSHFCNGNEKTSVWGKAGLDLVCGKCGKPFEPVE